MTAEPGPPPRASRWRAAVSLAFVAIILAAVAVGGYWAATGGRWFVVRTPSMGTAAPVGTLLWVKPVAFVDLHRGDVITFTPPGLHTTYSHRIYALGGDGSVTTKGDANASPDSWRLHGSDIVGEVTTRWWGVGWLVRALPVLVVGGLILAVLVLRFTKPRLRLSAVIVGGAFLLSLALYVYRPLVGADQIAVLPTDPGVQATYVSTGLLPLRLHVEGGAHVDLRAGQVGTVDSVQPGGDGRFAIGLSPLIPWWWWAILILGPFLPAMWTSHLARRRKPQPRHRAVEVHPPVLAEAVPAE